MSRRGLRDRWRTEVYRHDEIGDACRVLLLYLADRMSDAGRVSVPRPVIAAALGIDDRRVTARMTEATRAGLLAKRGGGYSGRTAEYEAVMPTRKVAAERPPLPGKVAGLRPPKNVHHSSDIPPGKVAAERPPIARVTNARQPRNANNAGDLPTATRKGSESAASVSEPARVTARPDTASGSPATGSPTTGSDTEAPTDSPPAADSPGTRRARPAEARLRSPRSRALWVPPETATQHHPIVLLAGGE